MKTSLRHLIATSLVGTAFSLSASAQAPSTAIESAIRINTANALVREGKVAEAIADYEQIQAAEADRDELNYNRAVAEYRHGDIESAKLRFSKSAASSDMSLAARSRYNLGNCHYSDALRAAEQDKPSAIESLRQAISHYRGSLAGNPNHVDARANIELAVQLLKKLQEEQKQEQQNENQPQPSDQNQSDPQNADPQQQDQQDSKSGQSESSKDQPQQGEQQQGSDQQKPDQPTSDQQEQKSEQPEQATESKPDAPLSEPAQQNQSDSQDSEGDQSKNRQAEQSAGEQQPENNSQSQQDKQSQTDDQTQPADVTSDEERDEIQQAVPAGELTAANEQDADGKSHGAGALADPNAKEGLMTKQEALKMLQAVRDRDMLRRLQQEQTEKSRHIAVDRDW